MPESRLTNQQAAALSVELLPLWLRVRANLQAPVAADVPMVDCHGVVGDLLGQFAAGLGELEVQVEKLSGLLLAPDSPEAGDLRGRMARLEDTLASLIAIHRRLRSLRLTGR